MPKTFRRFNFLQNIFPPGGAEPPQPGTVSDEIAFVHQVLTGTERLEEIQAISQDGAAGGVSLLAPKVPDTKYHFVLASSLTHDDSTARTLQIGIQHDGGNTAAIAGTTGGQTVSSAKPVFAFRSFILPPRAQVRGQASGMGGANFMTLKLLFLELDLGEPAPPSP